MVADQGLEDLRNVEFASWVKRRWTDNESVMSKFDVHKIARELL